MENASFKLQNKSLKNASFFFFALNKLIFKYGNNLLNFDLNLNYFNTPFIFMSHRYRK